MTPAALLNFEARHPGHPPGKEERIIRELGMTVPVYYMRLHRAAQSVEGIRADPITARSVRERAPRRTVTGYSFGYMKGQVDA